MTDSFDQAVAGLIRKRASLVGDIDHTRDRLTQLMADLDHLDATIRILDPDADVDFDKTKRPPPMFAGFRGELSRFLLDTLRTVDSITTHEMTERVMLARRLDPKDATAFLLMSRRVGNALRAVREKHGSICVRKEPPNGMRRWWMER